MTCRIEIAIAALLAVLLGFAATPAGAAAGPPRTIASARSNIHLPPPADAGQCANVRRYETDAFRDRELMQEKICRDQNGDAYVVPGSRKMVRPY